MASLKEIKQRIGSVEGTKKVTSAMKMVASAKLHKAQAVINGMTPYQRSLDFILANFMDGELTINSPYVLQNKQNSKKQTVAIIALSSNSSLCGAFNYNVIKELISILEDYKEDSLIEIYPIGKKVEEAVIKMRLPIKEIEGYKLSDYQKIAAKPTANDGEKIARNLMARFAKGELDKVIIIYQHFKSAGVQVVKSDVLLPLDIEQLRKDALSRAEVREKQYLHNYIVEPSVDKVIEKLLPQVVIQKLYTAMADSFASEHAARTVAMQVATDNAEELISELTIQYNKSRQQSITAELLDIVGGSIE